MVFKKTFLPLFIVILLTASFTTAFAQEREPWVGDPDPYACNDFQDCFWIITVCIEGNTYQVGIYYDPSEATKEQMIADAMYWSETELTIGTCPHRMSLIFDGLYAYRNPGYAEGMHPRDVCFIISTEGPPSVERKTANCDNKWPGGPRPGWTEGSELFAWGAVYYDGSDWGYWEGDMTVQEFSPNVKRLPLYSPGGGDSLFSVFCHYRSEIGQPVGWCK